MKLSVINSNSTGNCYVLDNGKEALIIECGVNIAKIKQAIGYNLLKVVGCIVTHEHKDHCISAPAILAASINLYATEDTHKAMGTDRHHRAKVIVKGKQEQIGGFTVLAFSSKHDCADPVGYIIFHPETGKILFLTDSYYSAYTFPGLNNIIIEANYCQKILDRRLEQGMNPKFLRDRVITSHMSLETCKGLLRSNDLSAVNNIVLIHLSDGNSDEKRFKKEVQELTGKTVHIARPGLTINNFNKQPF